MSKKPKDRKADVSPEREAFLLAVIDATIHIRQAARMACMMSRGNLTAKQRVVIKILDDAIVAFDMLAAR